MLATEQARYGVHLTPTCNLASIGEHGLIPSIGPAAKLIQETTPRIYLYADLSTIDDDLARRTGDLLSHTQQMAALLVDLSGTRPTKTGNVLIVDHEIPSARLDLLTPDLSCAKEIAKALRTYTSRRDAAIRRLGIPSSSWGLMHLDQRWESLMRGRRVPAAVLQRGLPGLEESCPAEQSAPRFRA